jgi:hypothetical protein
MSQSSSNSSLRARRVAVVCALVVMAAPLGWAPNALAAAGERPTIEDTTTTKVYEHEGTIEARIDPQGSETTYEIWLECRGPHEPTWPCEQRVEGRLAAGFEAKTVSLHLTGLQEGSYYEYGVAAANSAGQTNESGVNIMQDPVIPPGACPDGCSSNKPYEPEISAGVIKLSEEESARAVREYEAKHAKELEAQHAKEHEEQEFKEAAARATEATARKQREEQERDKGGLSLAATNVTVKGDGVALVQLECLGIASCRGKLTLTAKVVTGAKGKKKPARAATTTTTTTTTIGSVGFSIAGDATKTVKVDLNAVGRALLKTDHGHCSASLEILELAPGAENTQTKAVRLVQKDAAKAKKP